MKVYVLQRNRGEDRFIVGVYSSAKIAMTKSLGPWRKLAGSKSWHNDGADRDYAEINEYKVDK